MQSADRRSNAVDWTARGLTSSWSLDQQRNLKSVNELKIINDLQMLECPLIRGPVTSGTGTANPFNRVGPLSPLSSALIVRFADLLSETSVRWWWRLVSDILALGAGFSQWT